MGFHSRDFDPYQEQRTSSFYTPGHFVEGFLSGELHVADVTDREPEGPVEII